MEHWSQRRKFTNEYFGLVVLRANQKGVQPIRHGCATNPALSICMLIEHDILISSEKGQSKMPKQSTSSRISDYIPIHSLSEWPTALKEAGSEVFHPTKLRKKTCYMLHHLGSAVIAKETKKELVHLDPSKHVNDSISGC